MDHFSLVILSVLYTSTYSSDQSIPSSARVLTPFMNIGDLSSQKIYQIIGTGAIPLAPDFPDSGRTHAILEQESFVSKLDSAYGALQQRVADVSRPKPIVDAIRPHEKYGNDAEVHRSAAVAVVGAFEGLSNVLNAAVEVPFVYGRTVSAKLTKTSAAVGSKFVGR